jgi:hypothetical protein
MIVIHSGIFGLMYASSNVQKEELTSDTYHSPS